MFTKFFETVSAAPCEAPAVKRQKIAGGDLIITTGDLSDVDGFLALAEYFKTGKDVMYILNYPAYLGEDYNKESVQAESGLGFSYGCKFLEQDLDKPQFKTFMERYFIVDGLEIRRARRDNAPITYYIQRAFTDLAFAICSKIYKDTKATGKFYFVVGGINTVNPFSHTAIKNELLVYCDLFPKLYEVPCTTFMEGCVYNEKGTWCTIRDVPILSYDRLVVDFLGSAAPFAGLFDDEPYKGKPLNWEYVFEHAKEVVCVVMGGVYSDQKPQTMPAIPGVLNRFSSATMNQLYHPEGTRCLFELLGRKGALTYVVSNNVVHDLSEGPAEKASRTYRKVVKFMQANGLGSPFMYELAYAYYTSKYGPPRKVFDVYAAKAVVELLKGENELPYTEKLFFYGSNYGCSLLAPVDEAYRADGEADPCWKKAVEQYASFIDTEPKEGDSAFEANKKKAFKEELAKMGSFEEMACHEVRNLSFELGEDMKLRIV